MRIADILKPAMVWTDLNNAQDKEAGLRQLASRLQQNADVPMDEVQIFEALEYRESLGSTGVGDGVAIPHAKLPGLKQLVSGFCALNTPLPFDAIDGQGVRLFFVLLVPEDSGGMHLKALARVSRLFRNVDIRNKLLECTNTEVLYSTLLSLDDETQGRRS